MRILSLYFFLISSCYLAAQDIIPSPSEFLQNYGKQYSQEYKLNQYYELISQSSPKIKRIEYGTTWENRPLQLLFISSSDNIQNLENIRVSHLKDLGMVSGKNTGTDRKVLVWLSFGVHGNEAGASESVPQIIYQLLTNKDRNYDEWLKNIVVIIDPNLNPDGNSRYVHWINQVSGTNTHPEIYDREHFEPWPRGRYNHYLFDLNRDWAWQTQKETRQRILIYNQWLPHIHADFHEMGYEANYYFAPAAEPYHKYVSDFQKSFQTEIGKNHARYFDAKGLLYWTRERFDLFYPSYGDTYPTFNGAIGMTYEQAGHSMSGRAILLSNGDTLTLARKIENNTIVALSTIEMAVKNTDSLHKNLVDYFAQSKTNPKGKYKTYILKNSKSTAALLDVLEKSGIEYGFAAQKIKLNAYHYQSRQNQAVDVEKDDIVIQTAQPKSVLLQVLMEEVPELADSLTYDITAWSLPLAYNVDCYATSAAVQIKTNSTPDARKKNPDAGIAYAYHLPWDDVHSAHVLADLTKRGFRIRMAKKQVRIDSLTVQRGDLMITKGDNPGIKDFEKAVMSLDPEKKYFHPVSSGYSLNGGDIGGEAFELLKQPNVLLFSGEGTDATSVGEVWHYFEQILQYPLSIMDHQHFSRIDLYKYNTIILPGGWYGLSQEEVKELADWVKKGGRLIVLEDGVKVLDVMEGWGLQAFATDEEKNESQKQSEEESLRARTYAYESFERRFLSSGTAGAIVRNKVDETHPLGFGMGNFYYSLKTNAMTYRLQKDFQNVITVPDNFDSYGFIGHVLKSRLPQSVTLASKKHGKGDVICFVDNPLFRGFWYKGLQLFANAVFFPY